MRTSATVLGTTSPPAAAIGVVIVTSERTSSLRVAGLDAHLRHCLALQSAGVDAIYFVGAETPLPGDARLSVPVHARLPQGEPPDRPVLIVRADASYHRQLPARVLASWEGGEPLGVEGAGVELDALFVSRASQLGECVDAILQERSLELEYLDARVGEFVVRADSPEACRAVLRSHLRSLIKPSGGALDRHLMRPFSLQITRLLLGTSITPNLVTMMSLLLALVAAGLVSFDEPALYIAGAVLHFVVRIVDCVDGELARLRYQHSAFGQFLDTVSDGIGVAALMMAVTYRARDFDGHWLWLGIVGVILYALVQVLQLRVANAATGGGSLQAVDWAFLEPEAKGVDRLVGMIHGFVRIDFISTAYALLIALNQLQVLLVAHALASLGGVLYLVGQLPRKLGARTS